MSTSPLDLYGFQLAAAERAAHALSKGEGILCNGSTGCGKTLISLKTFQLVSETKARQLHVIAIVPSQGGNVPAQWRDEVCKFGGDAQSVAIYMGSKRTMAFESWRASAAEAAAAGAADVRILVTTADTFLADTAGLKGRGGGLGEESPLCAVDWDIALCDEAHMFRNGSSRFAPAEVDENKLKYSAVDRFLIRRCRPAVMLLTATPYRNSHMDMFSLARLWGMPECRKHAWLNRVENKRAWLTQKRAILDRIVTVAMPPAAATTHVVVTHTPTAAELPQLIDGHDRLNGRLKLLMKAIADARTHPGAEMRAQYERAQHDFEAQLTRTRRGALHGVFYDPLSAGGLGPAHRTEGRAPRQAKRDLVAVAASVPLSECSKFECVIEVCRSLTGKKALIMSYYTEPLRLLAEYMKQALPDRPVLLHHGGVDTRRAMREFEASPSDALMLATRGSIGEGVSIPWVTDVVFLDPARSAAEQQQAEGRVKRPLAQPGVTEWTAYHIRQSTAGRKFQHESTGLPLAQEQNVEDWLVQVQQLKRDGNIEMFSSAEERREAQAEAEPGISGETTLGLLWAVLNGGGGPNSGSGGRKRRRKDGERPVAAKLSRSENRHS